MKGRIVGFRMYETGPEVTIKISESQSGDVLPLNELVEITKTTEKVKP